MVFVLKTGKRAREAVKREIREMPFLSKKARPDRPGIKKPAHTGPAVLDPIFNIPGVRDRTTSARDNTNARECPQPTQRSGVPVPACKGVTMVFFPSHIVSLHYLKNLFADPIPYGGDNAKYKNRFI